MHSELFRLKNGRTSWDARTLVVVDEAAMLDSRITGELLAEARRSGAKLVLAGDDRQLASIERGGLFAELRQRHGSAEITEMTRQRVGLAAAGRARPGRGAGGGGGARLRARAGDHLGRHPGRGHGQAGRALGGGHRGRSGRRRGSCSPTPTGTSTRLNAELRQVRRERGELGEDVRLETKHGPADFAVGDRVQFTDTLKAARIYNGNAGTITAIDARTGVVAGDAGRPGRAGAGGGMVGRRSSPGSGTATPGRSTRARAGRWTTPTCTTRATGGGPRATWR